MRATQPVVSCFYTTVQNLAATPRVYGFLGRHGRKLRPNAIYTEPGDLRSTLAARPSLRDFQALERACAGFTDAQGQAIAASLSVISTPSVFLIDATNDALKVLRLSNNSLGTADPCTGSGTSASQTPAQAATSLY